ncbi:hypothetical protein ETH_00043685, partial [Eimeria tenella]
KSPRRRGAARKAGKAFARFVSAEKQQQKSLKWSPATPATAGSTLNAWGMQARQEKTTRGTVLTATVEELRGALEGAPQGALQGAPQGTPLEAQSPCGGL